MSSHPRSLIGEHGIEKMATKSIFDEPWSFKKLKKRLRIVVTRCDDEEMEFDFIGIHPALANCFRRIMLSDIPTMAIEKVHMLNNTTVGSDDELAHAFGLIPLKADARLFQYQMDPDEETNEYNSLEFELKAKCTSAKENVKNFLCAEDIYKNSKVTSNQIKWVPIGDQIKRFKEKDVGPIHKDILLTLMRPGHELDCKLIAVKGIGRDHMKFSPIVAAYYRLLPEIEIIKEVKDEAAVRLQKCFAPGVIDIKQENNKKVAVVKDARYDTGSRNVYKYPDLKESIVLTTRDDYLIYTIESAGALPPDEIFRESVIFLMDKCQRLLDELNQ